MGMGKPTTRAVRVRDIVRNVQDRFRGWNFSPEEIELIPLLRGQKALCQALTDLVQARIRAREVSPLPADPVDCKASMAADRELRWFLSKLDTLQNAPMHSTDEQTR